MVSKHRITVLGGQKERNEKKQDESYSNRVSYLKGSVHQYLESVHNLLNRVSILNSSIVSDLSWLRKCTLLALSLSDILACVAKTRASRIKSVCCRTDWV